MLQVLYVSYHYLGHLAYTLRFSILFSQSCICRKLRIQLKLKCSKHCKRDGPDSLDYGVRTEKLTSFVGPSNAALLSRFLGMKGMKSSLSQQEKGGHFSISDNVKHDLHDQNFPYLPTSLPPFYKWRGENGATFPLAQ